MPRSISRRTGLLAVAMLTLGMLAACGGGSDSGDASSGPTTTAAPASASDDTTAATSSGSGDGIDVCGWYSTDAASKVLGEPVAEAVAGEPSGSLLGQCRYSGDGGAVITISARPADEYEASAAAVAGTDVQGLGKAAVFSDSGMLVQPDGTDYFIQIIAMPSPGTFGDQAMLTSVAEEVLANT